MRVCCRRKTEIADLEAACAAAWPSIPEAVKAVKNQLKDPLADRAPVVLLKASRIVRTEAGGFALVDSAGNTLKLNDVYRLPQKSTRLLSLVDPLLLEDSCLLVMFEHQMDKGCLAAQPLTLIQEERVVRLLY
ncbi:hypothetical protein ACE41H_21550 [Paenibacillus enshidis]|uniref:Uncharacterized protein n=1 Tax=Paenibacillus enshidis TaxID=1458439 RepID=A0ABV5AYP3_9BACL